MKQIYLKPRGAFRARPRSDTLFGLLAHAVRTVYGRSSVERFLGPALETPQASPLYLTSAFPYLEAEKGRLHFFPAPQRDGSIAYVEDSEFMAFVSGRKPFADASPMLASQTRSDRVNGEPRQSLTRGGFFFLASGPMEHYLEAALRYLEKSGFGGGASHGLSQFDVELVETEFLRLAQVGERGVLLSLCAPSPEERAMLATQARTDERLAWVVERRQGRVASQVATSEDAAKAAIAMFSEGSVILRGDGKACGSAPRVAMGRDAVGEFPIVHHGFGFLVPLRTESAA